MRYAPKFLTPWERISRTVDEHADAAIAEIRSMTEKAMKLLPAVRYYTASSATTWGDDTAQAALRALQNAAYNAQYDYQRGLQALTENEMAALQQRMAPGMVNAGLGPWSGIGGALGRLFG